MMINDELSVFNVLMKYDELLIINNYSIIKSKTNILLVSNVDKNSSMVELSNIILVRIR